MTPRLVQTTFAEPPQSRLELDVVRLLDYALTHPDGFTHQAACTALGWDLKYFQTVERALRSAMSDQSENLTCNPDEDNPGGLWLYRMTADTELSDEWIANRLGDAETRLQTMTHMAASAVKARSGRTLLGKKARLIYKTTSRLLEDLEELRQESA